MRPHALLGASSASRWMACPPSARLTEQIPDRGSDYAAEGTLAHAIAENRLYHMTDDINGEILDQELDTLKQNEHFSPAMLNHTNDYANFVMEKYHEALARCKDAKLIIEARLNYSRWVPDGFGTGDAVIVSDGKLEIIDLKYGQGVPVYAFQNPQMRLYAAGALEEYGWMFDIREIQTTIYQPRLDNISIETLTREELIDWLENEVSPAAKLADKGKGEYKAGAHCQFCKAKSRCRTRKEAADALLDYEFKHPNLLSRDEIGNALVIAKELVKWASDLENYAFDELTDGREIPGWKLVEGRSNRTIVDPDKAMEILQAETLDETTYLKPKALKGITELSVYSKAENLIKDADEQWARILWEFAGSELAIDADATALKGVGANTELPKHSERLFRKLDLQGGKNGDFYSVFSPDIRDSSLFNGLNKILRQIEFNCGLAYGTLSEVNETEKTATEIKTSRQRSYSTVADIQKTLQAALENLIVSMDELCTLYGIAPTGEYETSFEFDDSLIVDSGTDQAIMLQEVGAGIIKPEIYLMKRYGLTEEQCKEWMPNVDTAKEPDDVEEE